MTKITSKTFKFDRIKALTYPNRAIKGLILKRKVLPNEAIKILTDVVGISIDKEDYEPYEWKEYKQELTDLVNDWLVGEADDQAILTLAYDCSDEQMGIFTCLNLLEFLYKKDVI